MSDLSCREIFSKAAWLGGGWRSALRKPKRVRARVRTLLSMTALASLCLASALAVSARAAAPPSIGELFDLLGFSEAERAAVMGGEIVTRDQETLREDHISAAVVMRLPVPVEALYVDALTGQNLVRDPNIVAAGPLKEGAADWQGQAFAASEADEARQLRDDRGGGDFNLSAAEALRVEAGLGRQVDAAAGPKSGASALYRELLLDRNAAYRRGGLAAIAPYRRNGTALDPEWGLTAVSTPENFPLLRFFPDFAAALADYPRTQRPGITHGHYWTKREIGGRPNYILAHQVVAGGEGYTIFAMREYYVGHTYEALQFVLLALPLEGGSLVVLVASTFANEATGFFGDLASWIGQRRMRDDLRHHFEALKAEPVASWPLTLER